jgi:AcrR family transcriptional regulator
MAPKFRRNKEKKINEILDTALKLTQEKGPNNFSVNDIPIIANVSIGTIYRYFPNGKEDILRHILLRNIDTVKQIIDAEHKTDSLEAYWMPIIRNMMELSNKYDAVSELMIESAPPDSQFYNDLSNDLMGLYLEMAENMKKFLQVDVSVEILSLRIGLCFRLLKKVLQSQAKVQLFDEDKIEPYLMKIVQATFRI